MEVVTGDILGRPGYGRREKAIVCSKNPKEPFLVFIDLSIGDGAWRGTVALTEVKFDRFDPDKGHVYVIEDGNWQIDEPMWDDESV